MFLNIITPCSRPENLQKIAQSINIPKEWYRWIVVFDAETVPDINIDAELYAIKDSKSTSGNAQRNYGLDQVTSGHVYFNDDDTTLHPELWDSIKDLDNDFISFRQVWKSGALRLTGFNVSLNNIDSHNFITSNCLIGDTRWVLDRYDADGLFAYECRQRSKTYRYIDRILSVYNSLK